MWWLLGCSSGLGDHLAIDACYGFESHTGHNYFCDPHNYVLSLGVTFCPSLWLFPLDNDEIANINRCQTKINDETLLNIFYFSNYWLNFCVSCVCIIVHVWCVC